MDPYLPAIIYQTLGAMFPSSYKHSSSHHHSKHKEVIPQDTLDWHSGDGMNFLWLSKQLSHELAVSQQRLKTHLFIKHLSIMLYLNTVFL